jgi:hypothetical protein
MRIQLRHIVPFALLWLVGCGAETPVAEALPAEAQAEQRVQEQELLQLAGARGYLGGMVGARTTGGVERRHVVGNIYHYSVRLQVGPNVAQDVITLHRVVKERAAWAPVRAPESVMMVHGDAWDFTGAFMASTLTQAVPVEHSLAIFLAQRDVDVWGVDLRWTHVPQETQDFSFMKAWNLGTHAQDVGKALAVARQVRRVTGSGEGKMNLLGWSRGALVSYAWMNAETQLAEAQRHVGGFIPVDQVLRFGPEGDTQRQWACVRAGLSKLQREAGRFEGNLMGPGAGMALLQLGQAAVAFPDVIAAPPMPPLPYRQLGITVGAATFSFLANPQYGVEPMVPAYHFTAGQFGADGLPVGLRYVQERQFFDFLRAAHPYQSFTEMVESEQLLCGDESLPYDDHLAQVKVPVLYVGAAGGYGAYGVHSTTLLGSQDVTVHLVQRLPAEWRVADYGHADLFLASDAATAVWAPIHAWMLSH